MTVSSEVTVTEQDPEEAQRAVRDALDIYCDALLATNEEIAAMVESFAPKHDPTSVRAPVGTDPTRAAGAAQPKGVAEVQELIVKADAAIKRFNVVVAASARMLNAMEVVGERPDKERLQRALYTLQATIEVYGATLRAAERALLAPGGRPDLMEPLSLQRSADASEHMKFQFFLDVAYQKYMKDQGGGTTQPSHSLAAVCSQDGDNRKALVGNDSGTSTSTGGGEIEVPLRKQ